jgi:hypothetical protein
MSMPTKFRAVVRRCYLDLGMPKVGREVVGLYPTRKQADDACSEFVKAQGDTFKADYDDCIIELVFDEDNEKFDG